ncbi:MAG: flagellar protein FlgN [Halioglobus sp.]|nr:flagellar protein FlgN [Halioglobus sp.]
MTGDAAPGRQLAQFLEREQDSLQRLRDVLSRERRALLEADVPALEAATAEKHRALQQQAEAVARRRDYLQRAGFADTAQGLTDCIAGCDDHSQLRAVQAALQTLARTCRDANRDNGRLISRKQQQTRGALDILRRSDGAAPTYTGGGNAVAAASGRLLGKA